MVSLSGSCYMVSYDMDDGYKVFVRDRNGLKEVTNSMSEEEKEVLIDDLVLYYYKIGRKEKLKRQFHLEK